MNWGFQELEAQAVAVRSYVLANLGGYGGYADTCDLTCQTYRGTQYETQTSIAAANDTAGQVMIMPGGQIATTEYSASTGGYTSSANQQSPFTAVPDDGDAVTAAGQPQPHLVDIGQLCNRPVQAPGRRSARSPASAARRSIPAIPPDSAMGGWTPSRSSEPGHPPASPFPAPSSTWTSVSSPISSPSRARRAPPCRSSGQGWGHGIGMGQWGALGLRHRAGQRRGELDVQPDRQPLLRSRHAAAACRAGRAWSAASPAAGSAATGSTRPTAASSASATRSSTAAPAACASTSPWSPWPRRTTPAATGRWRATVACSASATRRSTAAPGASA